MQRFGAIEISDAAYQFFKALNQSGVQKTPEAICADLEALHGKFYAQSQNLLDKRDSLQEEINRFFDEKTAQGTQAIATTDVVKQLEAIGYIQGAGKIGSPVSTADVAEELYPLAGPQLVVPADKVNMVLNASNARWGSLYNALYASNIVDGEERQEREQNVIAYSCELLNDILPLASGAWQKDTRLSYEGGKLVGIALKDSGAFVAVDSAKNTRELLFKNNSLSILLKVSEEGGIEDVLLESALTYIIDLEDASISTPESKLEGYRIIRGIVERDLECEVRGKTRKMLSNRHFVAPNGTDVEVACGALPLVRDVGMHLMVDPELLIINGGLFPEKILDCYITSLCGMRFHVAPKMHGADEIAYTVELFDEINRLQGLSKNANKIGVMNEEMRTTAQLGRSIDAASEIIFFTNTGFLDYTASFIDLMMHQGPVAPYRELPSKTYKTSYEVFNVNESLSRKVPQIGAGMWPKIRDMKGLMSSKKEQVEGCTDTGWSPSPSAATLHALAFHFYGDVRELQQRYLEKLPEVKLEQLFEFPRADIEALSRDSIIENLDFAIHGLLAYGEPWVRRGIGCSGVKELSGDPLMEDRATARIKTAFVRNWLLHNIVSEGDVRDSIARMVALVNEQNAEDEDYQLLTLDGDPVVEAVENLVFNPNQYQHSYVEFYFYEANRRSNQGSEEVYDARISS